jgi:excisionase family DNA binding protein
LAAEIKQFNSIEMAKILGVNVSTIKRWTDEGKLNCIKTAGGHRKFMIDHLNDYIRCNRNDSTEVNLFPLEDDDDLQVSYNIMKSKDKLIIDYLIEHALLSRHDKVQKVLNGLYLSERALYDIYDNIITPIMYRFGEMWHNDELSIIEEHFGSQTIRDSLIRLQGIMRIPNKKIGSAICLNLSDELHDIALKMVANILEVKGYQVYFSGQYTNIEKIELAFEKFEPERLFLSCTWVEDIQKTQSELKDILKICDQYETNIFLGGQGVPLLTMDHPRISGILETFEELFKENAS